MIHGFAGKCYKWGHNRSVGLLLLRVSFGAFFLAHGISKFQNMELMIQFFGSIGLASYWVYIVASAEILAGVLFIVGAAQWLAAILITVEMIVAMYKVTAPNPQGQAFLPHFVSGWGANLVYATVALCLGWCGAGRYSLTAWWIRRKGIECKDCRIDHSGTHDCCTGCVCDDKKNASIEQKASEMVQ